MISLIKKIKDTILNYHSQNDREEAMFRIRFLDYILFDLEFYGDFYANSFHIFKRYTQIYDGIDGDDTDKLQVRKDFLASALEDTMQLEFESWAYGQGIEPCDYKHYYSSRGWYDFYHISIDLLSASVSESGCNLDNSSKIVDEKLRSIIMTGKEEVGIC